MSSSLKQRLTAEPVRFVYQRDMPNALVEVLREKLTISRYDSIVPGGRYHNFKDFINFPNVGKANLVNKPLPRLRHIWFDKAQFRNGFASSKINLPNNNNSTIAIFPTKIANIHALS